MSNALIQDEGCEASHEGDTIIASMQQRVMEGNAADVVSNFFKAFSDGTRLRILHALSIHELCVGEICSIVGASQPAVSNHLRGLAREHIVRGERRGKHIFYSLDDWHINAIITMAMEHMNCLPEESSGKEDQDESKE